MATCPTCPPSSLVAVGGVLGVAPLGGASTRPACLPPTSRRPCIDAPVAASRVALRAITRSVTRRTLMVSVLLIMPGWLGMDGDMEFLGPVSTECSDVLCRIAAAIIRLEGRESKGGRRDLSCISGVNGEPPLELSPISPLDLRISFWTSSSR
ncbi:hypothetical protein BHE74_00054601 [Ensete ventricosum]|nr:hypothetical protein BHE74_00054601 [Ensete ventricosum]